MTDVKNMTERESYIIAQALYEFIRLEQSKPINGRRLSDERDAKAKMGIVRIAQSSTAGRGISAPAEDLPMLVCGT
jgi:hypothetical protein